MTAQTPITSDDVDALLDCPVRCEGCAVALPMAAALHTEDPVYLCGKCAAGAVESQMRAAVVAAERAREEAHADGMEKLDLAIAATRARDEVGVQYAAAQERLRLAMGLRDFAESPPIHWDIAEDRQTMTGRLDDATATLVVDGRVELRRDDGVLLARIDVHVHDGPVSGVLMDRAESQCEIAAALLWSHRRSNKLDAVRAWDNVPGDALAPKVEAKDEHHAAGTRVAQLEGLLREAQQWVVEEPGVTMAGAAEALDDRINAALGTVAEVRNG